MNYKFLLILLLGKLNEKWNFFKFNIVFEIIFFNNDKFNGYNNNNK